MEDVKVYEVKIKNMRMCELEFIASNLPSGDVYVIIVSPIGLYFPGELITYVIAEDMLIKYAKYKIVSYDDFQKVFENEIKCRLYEPDPMDTDRFMIIEEASFCKFRIVKSTNVSENPEIIEEIRKLLWEILSKYIRDYLEDLT